MKKYESARLSVEIRRDQHEALQRLIPWGDGAAFWRAIVDDVILMLEDEETRYKVIALVSSGKLKALDWSRLFEDDS